MENCAGYLHLKGVCISSIWVPLSVLLFMGFSRQEYWSGLPFPPPIRGGATEDETLSIVDLMDMSVCRGPAPVDPGNSKGRRHR